MKITIASNLRIAILFFIFHLILNPVGWSQFDELTSKDLSASKMERKKNGFEIFGWHPYWIGSAYENYNFQLLDYLSWYSYDINPETGSCNNADVISELRKNLPEFMKLDTANNCQFLLTITCYGFANTRQFLSDQTDQQAILIKNVLMLVEELGLNGIDINFEYIHEQDGRAMSSFINKLSGRLKELNPNHLLVLTLPKSNNGKIYTDKTFNNIVDLFPIVSYFQMENSSFDGPIAPLEAEEHEQSIKTIVSKYHNAGIDPKKMLLGLPLYGGSWISDSPKLRTQNHNLNKHQTYMKIMASYGKTESIQYDSLSSSAYFIKKIQDNYEKVWFEDSLTLTKKMDWAREKGLRGVAIWALGYDNGRTEIWSVIDKSTVNQDENKEYIIKDIDNVRLLKAYKWHLLVLLGVFLLFGLLRKRKKKT